MGYALPCPELFYDFNFLLIFYLWLQHFGINIFNCKQWYNCTFQKLQ